jgi:hypothetical protein
MKLPTFEELAAFIRVKAQVPIEQPIRAETQFECDLGVTGEDGSYLVQEIEKHFAIQLATDAGSYREAFGLGPQEYLFNSEGFTLWELLPFAPKSTVRTFTVGELHEALTAAASAAANIRSVITPDRL